MEKRHNHGETKAPDPFALTQANVLIPNWLNGVLLDKGKQRGGASRSSLIREDLCEIYKEARPE